jgi:hypothetical protein
MKCKRVHRYLPLMIGGDLAPNKAERVQKHVELCPGCQDEFRMYRLSLKRAIEWVSSEKVDWKESEWMMSLRKASHFKQSRKMQLAPWPFKKGWALAMMAVLAVLLTLFALYPSLSNQSVQRASTTPEEIFRPEILSLRLVSQETGLKINWFFHKDLKLEVMK